MKERDKQGPTEEKVCLSTNHTWCGNYCKTCGKNIPSLDWFAAAYYREKAAREKAENKLKDKLKDSYSNLIGWKY